MAAPKMEALPSEVAVQLPAIRDEWTQAGLATGPGDRAEAERGIRLAYTAANLPEPRVIVWLRSPMEGALGDLYLRKLLPALFDQNSADQVRAQVGAQVWDQVRDQVRAQVGDQVRAQVGAQVWAQVGAQVRDQVRAQVWAQVGAQVWDQVGDQVRAQVVDQVGNQVRNQVGDQVSWSIFYGQHDAGWLSFYATFAKAGLSVCERLNGLNLVARHAGWVWPLAGAVTMTERPTRIARDDQGRLHCENAMAIEYGDGWGFYAWHGVRVEASVILDDPATWNLKDILAEPNAEVRRVKLERFGGERMREAATLRQRDDCGNLYELAVPGDENPYVFVDVENSTAEPDGHYKRYCLAVPPTMQTCTDAVAWTFGLTAKEYVLAGQS